MIQSEPLYEWSDGLATNKLHEVEELAISSHILWLGCSSSMQRGPVFRRYSSRKITVSFVYEYFVIIVPVTRYVLNNLLNRNIWGAEFPLSVMFHTERAVLTKNLRPFTHNKIMCTPFYMLILKRTGE